MAAVFIVEDGSVVSNANSYLSVAEADGYHENHSGSTDWSGVAQAEKEKALRLATQYLDAGYGNAWRGYKYSDTQVLAWPRAYAEKDDNYSSAYYENDEIPQNLKDACAELALKVIEGDTLLGDIAKPGTIKSKTIKAGPIIKSVEYVGGMKEVKKYPLVEKLISSLIQSPASIERG